MLYEPPRIALEEVAAATILDLFSNSILPLFQLITNTLEKLSLDKDCSFFILGADAALGIKSWHNYEILFCFN